ncbi:MAG TPA: FAD-dependent oxidoreductase, partial [Anaerolineaceae bacterium]|nr:FAD-dependent oxidoreductase [Anaerolineaceae bacterium]
MARYDYVIIGGGMTAAAAVKGIREVDSGGTIAVFSMEPYRPYNRPPLTKKLWQGKPEDSIWSDLPADRLDWILDCRVTALDPYQKQVQDETGQVFAYG